MFNKGLQEGFTRSVFNKGLQKGFTKRVYKKGLQEGFTKRVFNKCVYYKRGSEVLTGLFDSYLNR